MKCLLRLCAVLCLAACFPSWGQVGAKVARVEIRHVGPASVSDALIRANIRIKPGDSFQPLATDEDVRNLYATGLFLNVQVSTEMAADGLNVIYVVQPNPRLTDVKFEGNRKYSSSKLQKKISTKPGEPFNERKLFTDRQEIEKMYQKAGYPNTKVEYAYNIDENTGRATATFKITEGHKVKIREVDFVGAQAFSQKTLRKVVKTRKHWMFSWITGHGFLKQDQLEEDRDALLEYYRDHGYLDFEIKDVQLVNPTPRTMQVKFIVYEGKEYHVGSIKFTGNKLFSLSDLTNGLKRVHAMRGGKGKVGPNGLPMDVGDVFTPKGLSKDTEAVEDFYGTRGYIDVSPPRTLNVVKIPNTETGTMDLDFEIDEGQKSYIEKINIRGNIHTKDRVIRRELAVAPGEVFDMVRVKRSKERLMQMNYFEKVDARPESTDVPNRRDLVVGVDEKKTGNVSLGAGFSSVDSIVGFVEYNEGNFDLQKLLKMQPWFQGGGQRFRLRVAIGTERQDYIVSFVEPWFLGRKLTLGVDAYYRDLGYYSDEYNVLRGGAKLSLTRALGSEFFIGSLSYTLENVGIKINSGYNEFNTPPDVLKEEGYSLLSRVGGSLAFDTRNAARLPSRGQRSELSAEVVGMDKEFYKLEFKTAWYFPGLFRGHILEVLGHTGVAESLESDDVPFYERYYLGGLYSLRGYRFHHISPRQGYFAEPIGGDTYWYGSAEYSIPIIEQERGIGVRVAFFYDLGAVAARPYNYQDTSLFNDNWGVGLRLNLPIGPLRLDYGIPIHHDKDNKSSGEFQFGVGYTREF